MAMIWLTWLTTIISIAGTVLVIRRRKAGFYLWCVSNAAWVAIDVNAQAYAHATLFAVYLLTSIYGAWEWQQERRRSRWI